MDLALYAMAGLIIIGLVNGIQFAFDKNWKSFTFFVVALIAGAIFGYLKWFGLPSIEIGIAVGLSSSGVYKIAQVI